MLLFSFGYITFLIIVFLLFYAVNGRFKKHILFFASIIFIGFLSLKVAIFSLCFTLLNYFLGLWLEKNIEKEKRKSRIFWLSITLDIGFLAFFKYINFIFENFNSVLNLFTSTVNIPYLKLFIPIGISYYTFQVLGYIIRINRGHEKAEKDFFKFGTYLLFFPRFLSGPVERSNHFLPQLENFKKFDSNAVTQGLRLFLWGAFKKIVIADSIYEPISLVYGDIHCYTGMPLVAVLFLQIIYVYCDFSGYTDMALGSAKIFGIDLIDNFKRPFLARTISEFWKRWHISLSSWCNDFIFNPFIVKYRRWGNTAAVVGIFLTFFIIGIWHGANWTFVILGVLQGIAIIYEYYSKRKRMMVASKLPKSFVYTASRILVYIYMSISLVFFFSNSVSDAWYLITHLGSNFEFTFSGYELLTDKTKFLAAMGIFFILFVVEMFQESGKDLVATFQNQPKWIRWSGYYILIVLIYYFNSASEAFVYMEF